MKKNILISILILYACNHVEKKSAAADLQKLSSILTTTNWRITGGSDTSYIYFSQQADNTYTIYEYKLVHGDSSITWQGSISALGDSVVWNWDNHLLKLEQIFDIKANWKEKSTNENYVLQKINDSSLQLSSSTRQLMLKKTLPLSTFLVRAKYDYEHGTQFLDSVEVLPKRIIQKL
ncbi:MAG TPA: hypothetical protein VGQ09_07085 [Chitinophagaceae bacterium]|jgi:hypothetical protein|nr:hypothetical protein [Chitinophagaceae bacterium]